LARTHENHTLIRHNAMVVEPTRQGTVTPP